MSASPFARAVALLLAWAGSAACGGATQGSTAAAPHAQGSQAGQPEPSYEELARRLDEAASTCKDACCDGMSDLPGWSSWWTTRTEDDPKARARALAALRTSRDPRVLSLALLRLSAFALIDDVDRVAAFVERTEAAAPLRSAPPMSQQPVFCPAPPFVQVSLGETALLVLGKLAAQRFDSVTAYRQWRAANPDPTHSVAYWESLLAHGDQRVLGARLRALDRDLLCRIALAPAEPDSMNFSDNDRLECAGRIGPERLLALLTGDDTSWPELADQMRNSYFSTWVLSHAEAVLVPSMAARLLELSEAARRSENRLPANLLAVAASRLDRDRRRQILVAAASPPSAVVGAELATWFAAEEAPRIHDAFYADTYGQSSILEALGRTGAPARAALRAIALDDRFPIDDWLLLSDLARAVHFVDPGARVGSACDRLSPGGKELGRLESEERQARIDAARVRQRRCSARVRQLLAVGDPSTPGTKPSPTTCEVPINSIPVSQIYVDGKLVGTTPQLVVVSAGMHTITYVHAQRGTKTRKVQCKPGARPATISDPFHPR